MPLINPTIGVISQFIAPYDLRSNIESTWESPIASAKKQFTIGTFFFGPKDPYGYAGKTYDQKSKIEKTWINPIKTRLYGTKPDNRPYTYNPNTFIVGSVIDVGQSKISNTIKKTDGGSFTYDPTTFIVGRSPIDVKQSTLDDITTRPDDQNFTYDPTKFVVTSSYSADIKSLTIKGELTASKLDNERYTYDPISFTTSIPITTEEEQTKQKRRTLQNNTNTDWQRFAWKASSGAAASLLPGLPLVAQGAQAYLLSTGQIGAQYATLPFDALTRNDETIGILYPDFRAKRIISLSNLNSIGDDLKQSPGGSTKIRIDGASAAVRGSKIAGGYVTAASTVGAYSIFNIDGSGQTGYGIGDPGTPLKVRNDFTMRSHVAKNWEKDDSGNYAYRPTSNLIEKRMAFVGDRVNVIDYQRNQNISDKKRLRDIYKWKNGDNELSYTRDFIKFFFTGPGITKAGGQDDVIVFRATIGSLRDTFSPQWSEQRFIGRADPNFIYTQYSRDVDLDFTIIATDRDELQPIWRKLNALAGYTTPDYTSNLAPIGPWMRMTLGDLYQQQPCFINSLTYTLHDTDTTWEINLEDDPAMMQTPHKIGVSMGLTLVTDTIPQKNGTFYGFESRKDKYSWLNDFYKNETYGSGSKLV